VRVANRRHVQHSTQPRGVVRRVEHDARRRRKRARDNSRDCGCGLRLRLRLWTRGRAPTRAPGRTGGARGS
jgi:hypothetical protein